jgi:hypothetical protein
VNHEDIWSGSVYSYDNETVGGFINDAPFFAGATYPLAKLGQLVSHEPLKVMPRMFQSDGQEDVRTRQRKFPLAVGPVPRGSGFVHDKTVPLPQTRAERTNDDAVFQMYKVHLDNRNKQASCDKLEAFVVSGKWPQECTSQPAHCFEDLEGAPTTLMIRNIPPPYTPEDLIQEWPNDSTYDFFYLSFNSRLQRNLTYAFINFTSPEAALEFKCQWQNMRLGRHPSQKPLNIGVADMQGRDENLRQLRKKRLLYTKTRQCQPVVFRSGVRIPLEKAIAQLDGKGDGKDPARGPDHMKL